MSKALSSESRDLLDKAHAAVRSAADIQAKQPLTEPMRGAIHEEYCRARESASLLVMLAQAEMHYEQLQMQKDGLEMNRKQLEYARRADRRATPQTSLWTEP